MARFPVFADLSPAQVQSVLALARRRRFRRAEVIFHEGDPGDSVHLIDAGHVAIRVTTPLGDVATVRVLGPGDLFGEMAVLGDQPRMASAVALGAVETLSLPRGVVDSLRAERASVDRILLTAALAEVRRLSIALMEAYYVSVPKRMARALGQLATQFGATIPLTQDDLAGLCGTTRQTANEVLRALAERGAVALRRGRVELLDQDLLAKLAR